MNRIKAIGENELYMTTQAAIDELEKDRLYCGHSLDHALSVARLMYIYVLEDSANIEKEIIYATALLHDLGRAAQYTEGEPHEKASVRLAKVILSQCGFDEEEINIITDAISMHREKDTDKSSLGDYLYRADKKSRNCFACDAADTCNWPMEKRNLYITE